MIRYGIIGCGSMGREHIENIRALGGGGVTAIADPTAASREQASVLLDGNVQLFEHHGELLKSGLCDAVIVASPNFTHIEVMRDALATELHILCEKPLVTNMADGIEMLERAKQRKAIAWVAQEYRYMPPVAEMIRIAHDGGVGTLHQVAIREHREPFYPKVGDWNRFSTNTGGTLVEKCCHYFNLMDFILKEKPLRVFASGGQRVNHLDEKYGGKTPDILDSAYVIVEYPSGARASLDLCMFAENSIDNEHVSIVGAEGKLESLLPSGVLRYGRREDWGKRAVWGQPSGTAKGVAVRQIPRPAFRRQLHRAPEVRACGQAWAAARDQPRRRPALGGHRLGRAQEHRRRARCHAVRGFACRVVN
jgi:myo-inositol 2-dehydrogenase / D-chiro-inositol 1-dehydrogenase